MPRGFDGIRKASQEIESRRGSGGPSAFWFKLPQSGDQAKVRFLEQGDDVVYAMMHEVPVQGRQWGVDVPCLDQDQEGIPCPGCENDLNRRFRGYVNVIWFDAPVFKTDEKGKMVRDRLNDPVVLGTKDQVAVWASGIRLFEELDEIDTNYKGLMSRPFNVKRKGTGLDTKYVITPADTDGGAQEMSASEVELLKNKYDLAPFVTPGTYDEFVKRMGDGGNAGLAGAVANGGSAPAEPQSRPNPFMRNR